MMKSAADCRIPAFQKGIKFHVICKTYNKFSKFVRFKLQTIREELEEYLFPVFLHIYMQLIRMNRKYEAYEFCSLFSNLFSTDQSKVRAIKDLLRFDSYGDAVTHFYIHQFGFSTKKYVKLSYSSHDLLMTWLKKNKFTFIKEIIDINILATISEESTDIGKYLALHLGAKGDKQSEAEVLDLELMNTEEAETSDSDSLSCNDESAAKKQNEYEEPYLPYSEAMKGLGSRGLDLSSIDPKTYQNEPGCCDYLFLSFISGNKVITDANLKYGETLKHQGNIASCSSTRQQSNPSLSSHGSCEMHDLHKPYCPGRTAIFIESKSQSSCSSTNWQNIPKFISSCSNEARKANEPYCPEYSASVTKQNLQSNKSSSNGKNVPKFLSSGSNKALEVNEPYSTDYSALATRQNTQYSTSSNGEKAPKFLSFGSNKACIHNEPYCTDYSALATRQNPQSSISSTSGKNVPKSLSSGSKKAHKRNKHRSECSASVTKQNRQSNTSSITEHISNFQGSTIRCDGITKPFQKNSQGNNTNPSSHFATDSSLSFYPTVSSSSNQSTEVPVEQQNADLRHKQSESFSPFEIVKEVFKSPVEISRVVPEVCLLTVKGSSQFLACADVAEDGTFVFGGFLNVIRGWDLQHKIHDRVARYLKYDRDEGSTARTRPAEKAILFKGHTGVVNGISYNGKEQLLLSGSEDETIKVWSMKDHVCMQDYDFHHGAVIDVCNSPATAYFASASADWTAAIWNYDYKKPILRFTEHEGEVTCIRFHPNSYYVATGSDDETIKLWTTTDAEIVRLFVGHEEKITCLAFSPCGNYLISADMNGYVKIWDIKSGQTLNSFLAHKGTITSISYNSTGTFLAIGGSNGCLRIFNLHKLGTPVSEEEENVEFLAALKNSFQGYHDKASLDLVSNYTYKERDVISISFIKNNLLMGIAGHSYL